MASRQTYIFNKMTILFPSYSQKIFYFIIFLNVLYNDSLVNEKLSKFVKRCSHPDNKIKERFLYHHTFYC